VANTLVTNYLHQIYPPIPLRALLYAKLYGIIHESIAISNPGSNIWGFFLSVDNLPHYSIDIITLMLYTSSCQLRKEHMTNLTTTSLPAEVERKLIATIELQKQLNKMESELKTELLEAMKQHDIVSIKNDNFTISLVTRASYKGDINSVPVDMLKTSLDTTKVGNYEKLYGQLPTGVDKSETEYVMWRTK